MIPLNFLREMGVYNLNLDGITIQAKVVDNEELANDGVAELRSRLHESFPIVGLDLKFSKRTVNGTSYTYPLLVLYVKDRCLLLQLGRMSSFPQSVLSLLRDQTICFLGLQVSERLKILKQKYGAFLLDQVLKTGVDIGTFAARALHNRELEGCVNLVDLASKAGLPTHDQKGSETKGSQSQQVSNNNPDWGALCFTQEEVKFALENAYVCYSIGTKLMNAL